MAKKEETELTEENVGKMVKEFLENGGKIKEYEAYARTENLDVKSVWTKRKKN